MTDAARAGEPVAARSAAQVVERVVENLQRSVRAPRATLELCVLCLVAEGHLIIEDFPGVGKTVLAKSVARSLDLSFSRLQFTPDLLPTDVTGVNVFNQRSGEFEFRPGPVFANVLLVDEINRASPKTQSALLEAMQEAQVTIDGVTYELEQPFFVIATQNPIEYEGTYPLPEAQLDRFLLRVSFGYPSPADEWEVLTRRLERREDEVELNRVIDAPGLLELQAAIEDVHVGEAVGGYIVDLVGATCADNGCGHFGTPQSPGDCQLSHALAASLCDRCELIDQLEVRAQLRFLKLRIVASMIVAGQVIDPLASHLPGQQTFLHRTVDDDSDVIGRAVRQQLRFDAAHEHAVGRLERCDRRDGLDAGQLIAVEIADPAIAHFATLHQ